MPMRTFAFTGTRKGMSREQKRSVFKLLHNAVDLQVRHGGCHGADTDFHQIALKEGLVIYVHPGDAQQATAFQGGRCIVHTPPLPYLKRNHIMVDYCDALIACPSGQERVRSGTWATVRYARRQGKPIFLVQKGGRILEEEG